MYKIRNLIFKVWQSKYTFYFIITLLLIILFSVINYRDRIAKCVGDGLFGAWTYNIEWAETFYNIADKSKASSLPWLNYQLARVHFIKGNLIKSIDYSNLELELYPANCRSYYMRGLAYGYLEKLEEAISDFEKFNSCIPLTWAGHNDLAWLWYRLGNATKSVEIIERVNIIYEYNPWLQNTYGVALMNIGRYDEAKKAFDNAKLGADTLTVEAWGNAYPGNNPLIYETGLQKMRENIEENIKLLSTYRDKK